MNNATEHLVDGWAVLAAYPSRSGSAVHKIRMGKDGVVYCTCRGWRFHRNCWHLRDFLSKNASFTDSANLRPDVRAAVKAEAAPSLPIPPTSHRVKDDHTGFFWTGKGWTAFKAEAKTYKTIRGARRVVVNLLRKVAEGRQPKWLELKVA